MVHEVSYNYDADYKLQAKNLREKLRHLEDTENDNGQELVR